MSDAFSVIPRPEERGYRKVGLMWDVDGIPILLSVVGNGTVRIEFKDVPSQPANLTCADLGQEQCEEFARLFVSACWEAARLSTEVT